MLVRVATATGRNVLEVAHDSFALTLWTYWHLEERERRDAISQRVDRFDLASLVTIGRVDPPELDKMLTRYLSARTVPLPTQEVQRSAAEARALAHIAAHRRMTPIPGPEDR